MKKIILLLSLLATFAQANNAKKMSVKVTAEPLNGSAYYVPGLSGAATEYEGFISNAGFIVTSDGVVVFDSLGTPTLARAMLDEIRKITNKPIKLVIVSHYHADHIYGLQIFKEQGAQIWAAKGAWDYLQSETATKLLASRRTTLSPWVNDKTHLITPDRLIDKDTRFSLGAHQFLLTYFGKVHSEGDMSLLSLNDKTFYAGDLIFAGRIPFVGDADIIKWLKTLDKVRDINMEYFVPGHGLASNQPQKTMNLTYRYLNFLLKNLTLAVNEMTPFDEAYQTIDWSEFKNKPAFKEANRGNAYAVYLYLEQVLD